jgi:hypothetical protein
MEANQKQLEERRAIMRRTGYKVTGRGGRPTTDGINREGSRKVRPDIGPVPDGYYRVECVHIRTDGGIKAVDLASPITLKKVAWLDRKDPCPDIR